MTPRGPLPAASTVPVVPAEHRPAAQRGRWRRDALRRRLLAGADLVTAVGTCLALGILPTRGGNSVVATALVTGLWLLLGKLHGLYDRDHRRLRTLVADELSRVLAWAATGTGATVFVISATGTESPSAVDAVRLAVAVAVVAPLTRTAARHLWRQVTPAEVVLIVGHGALADAARRKLALFGDIHATVGGVVDERELVVDRLERVIAGASRGGRVDRIIVGAQAVDESLIAGLVQYCRGRQVKLGVVPPARGMFGTAVQLEHLAELPVIQYNTWDVPRSTLLLKRALDVAVSGLLLLVLAPLFLLIAVAIRLDSRGPALFVQRRAGAGGDPFAVLKFRTMVADAEQRRAEVISLDELHEPVFKVRDDPRVTAFGRRLRRTSLDELPQLINVLLGHMSLVGPRPEELDIVGRYSAEQRIRLIVRPGMTGPMQVFGRGELTFEERLAVEREYIEHLSIGRDVRLLLMTVSAVLRGRGAF